MLPPIARVLWAPKEGNADAQYEDAYATTFDSAAGDRFTAALADGASSAVFAREWAHLLVARFAGDNPIPAPRTTAEATEVLSDLGAVWRAAVEGKATSWYAQEKLPQGSSAALLVIDWDAAARTWTAASVGDVCIFLVRENKLKYAFPITKSTRFDDRPALLSTEVSRGAALPPFTRFGATFLPGDRFLLMSDAVAAYFLAEWEAKRKPWNDLPSDQSGFPAWLKARRDSGKLKNDDVTVLDVTL